MLNTLKQVELKPYNTFQVCAKAQYFLQLDSITACLESLELIAQHPKRMVLGGGSNVLFTTDFDGLIIYPQLFGIELIDESPEHVIVSVGASQNWHEFVVMATDRGWFGLENLALIPGTVGASPVQNIGAYGVEVKQLIECVEAVDLQTGAILNLSKDACQFAYRDSIFKQAEAGRYLITRVVFKLYREPRLCLDYQPLATFFKAHHKVTPQDVLQRVCEIRREKLPDPQQLANAGSFFKNPLITQMQFNSLQQQYPDIVAYPSTDGVKLAAGWLIERAGLKGLVQGKVGVHKHQALVVVSYGETRGIKIWQLAQAIRDRIQSLFGVALEVEVRVVGETQPDIDSQITGGNTV